MKLIKPLASFLFLVSAFSFSQSNATDNLSLNSGTIDSQFEYVIQKSNNYQDFKVVKKAWLYTLKAHAIDSLNAVHKTLSDTKAIVDIQSNEISSLKQKLSQTQETLDSTNLEKDSMNVLGLQTSKISYNMLMWTIIGVLLLLLLFYIYRFKNSNIVTQKAQKSLTEIEEEFEEHRRVALEREQKVRRQLQDEINKHRK
ncbi:MAG: tRNA (guanine-N1)-methyltransferase [Aestuariibaculum sp.]